MKQASERLLTILNERPPVSNPHPEIVMRRNTGEAARADQSKMFWYLVKPGDSPVQRPNSINV